MGGNSRIALLTHEPGIPRVSPAKKRFEGEICAQEDVLQDPPENRREFYCTDSALSDSRRPAGWVLIPTPGGMDSPGPSPGSGPWWESLYYSIDSQLPARSIEEVWISFHASRGGFAFPGTAFHRPSPRTVHCHPAPCLPGRGDGWERSVRGWEGTKAR
jgi:hypothetical protein